MLRSSRRGQVAERARCWMLSLCAISTELNSEKEGNGEIGGDRRERSDVGVTLVNNTQSLLLSRRCAFLCSEKDRKTERERESVVSN